MIFLPDVVDSGPSNKPMNGGCAQLFWVVGSLEVGFKEVKVGFV
jgi:hypothetical protein